MSLKVRYGFNWNSNCRLKSMAGNMQGEITQDIETTYYSFGVLKKVKERGYKIRCEYYRMEKL